jgi:DNA-binding LacI/PurR family transcriptional regulator
VSRILNGHAGVHEDTHERVLSEMKRLNFQPNMMARSLRGAKTGLVGVCLPEIESPILARKISEIQTVLHVRGLRAIMEVTSGRLEEERNVINHFLSMKVDGIILVGSTLDSDDSIFARLNQEGASVVAVDAACDVPLPRVELDRQGAMLICLRHLRQRGHNRFALLGLESDPVYGFRRIEGLKAAAEKLEIPWKDSFVSIKSVAEAGWSYGYGHSMAQELMQMESPPTGVIALNDEVAIGAMKAIKEWGFSVPKDFAVIGFDNLSIGQWVEPGLTSIAQNVSELIEKSVEFIQGVGDVVENSDFPIVKVQPKLIVRGSS